MPENIRKAIQECLNRSVNSDSTDSNLGSICERLRQEGWNEDQICTFRSRVLRLLRRLRVENEAA